MIVGTEEEMVDAFTTAGRVKVDGARSTLAAGLIFSDLGGSSRYFG
ncbi:MAG: hypothetical protein ABSD75_08785 [Terriglobales bacterium]